MCPLTFRLIVVDHSRIDVILARDDARLDTGLHDQVIDPLRNGVHLTLWIKTLEPEVAQVQLLAIDIALAKKVPSV